VWLFVARAGYFSAVERDGHPDQLVVRARDGDDLLRLRKLYLPELGEILNLEGTDYPVRAHTTKKAFSAALAKAVEEITFANFKAETERTLGKTRAAIYGEVWRVLLRLTRPSP
jgi:hypothetical protein